MDKIPEIMGSKLISQNHLKNCTDKLYCKCNNQDVRKRFGQKPKLLHNDFSLKKMDASPNWRKLSPNYFVAVQISNHIIHETVRNIQSYISSQDPHLDRIMVSVPTLHITLMVMYIGDEETYLKAMNALANVHKELNDIMCSQPLKLEFNGLDHFKNRVLYAKIQENESYHRLCHLCNRVKAHFAQEEILSTDKRTEFNPHLTIAKIDYSCKKQRAIKKIDPLLYEKYNNHHIGNEIIQSIQLLSMEKPKDDSGYYTGEKLFFNVPEAC